MSFLFAHRLLNKNQRSFLAKHSTGTQLLKCLNDWSRAIELDMNIDICYIDFSKAFNSVSISKLLIKLPSYGLTG